MRSVLVPSAILSAVIVIASAVSAQAERRTFIIANNPDGYGVDRCLANGLKCGSAIANSYCQSRDYKRAISFRKVGRGETVSGAPYDAYACSGRQCQQFIAIECFR